MESTDLKSYTVKIKASNKSGTGFFVAPGIVLTCAHVVTEGNNLKLIKGVEVYWQGQNYNVTDTQLPANSLVDLALLKVESPIPEHRCVALDATITNGDKLYCFAYPDDYPEGEPRDFIYTGLTGDNSPLMTFRGEQVKPGFSGAPLLNQSTGKICGLVKRSRDIHISLGGRGVSTTIIFESFPELKPTVILDNPFNHLTGRIEDSNLVFGREQEIKRVFELLNGNNSVALVGEPEIGKSSLLKVIEERSVTELKKSRKPIYLNLGDICDESDFYYALSELIGIPECKGFRLSRELKKHQLLLILDDVEKMAWNGFTNQVRSQIRSLAEGIDAPLRLVIAARKPLNQLFTDSSMVSPFENICIEEQISSWSNELIDSFIVTKLENYHISFSSQETDEVISQSIGNPKKVMGLCYEIFQQYRQQINE